MKTVSYLKYVFVPFFKRNVNVIFKLKIYFASTRQPGKQYQKPENWRNFCRISQINRAVQQKEGKREREKKIQNNFLSALPNISLHLLK